MTATTPSAREVETRTVRSDGADIVYDVHGDAAAGVPLLVIGSPMGASGFAALVAEITDRSVVTYDPRGVERSKKDDPSTHNTAEQHAADLQRIVDEIGVEQVDVFASSGGAVVALAWVQAGGPLRTLVAHEPPIFAVLPDREHAEAIGRRMAETYDRDGFGPAMAQFISLVMHPGPFTEADAVAPAPDPAMFGLPTTDDGSRTDPLLWQNRPITAWQPDVEALRASSTNITLAVGEESRDVVTGRATVALAEQLGIEPVWFPGGHGGFAAEDGTPMGGVSVAFGARLREVLAG